jgi:ABC-type phosphate transport system substrate-binding protein
MKARAYILGLGVILASAASQAQDVVIVVHRGVSISRISSSQLKDIFTGVQSRFADGTRAIPVVLRGGPAQEVFLRNHVGDNPDEFRTRWRRAVFTGQGSMPREFNTEAALLQYVAATPGAIGYVSRVSASDPVKVLIVSP